MSENMKFIEEIIKHPNDPALRRVFADWLEEQGECERAKVVCQQAEETNWWVFGEAVMGVGYVNVRTV